MGLNGNATTHLANRENTAHVEYQAGKKGHLSQDKMIFYGERHLKSRGQ